MSKLFVEQVANGNPTIVAEYTDNEQGAIVKYHQTCKALWNDAPTTKALVEILNENLNTWGGFREDIDKLIINPPAYNANVEYSEGNIVSYENTAYIYISDTPTQGNLPTDTNFWSIYTPSGKLYVMKVANDNLAIEEITEWIPNNAGIKGAMVDYHSKCVNLWNDPDAITANVMIVNEHLDTWNGKSEYIAHSEE